MPLPKSRANYPYWYYAHVSLVAGGASLPPQLVLQSVKAGYSYHLQGILCTYPADPVAPDEAPVVQVQLILHERSIPLFESSDSGLYTGVALRNISSPGGNRAQAGGQRLRGARGFLAVDTIFSPDSVIKLIVAGMAGGLPESVDLIYIGRLLKEGALCL